LHDAATYRVSELAEELQLFLREAYGSIWVTGEVQRLHRSRTGHLYFELVEKGDGDQIVAKLDAALFRNDARAVERLLARHDQSLTEGMAVRCRAGFDLYPPTGRLQLIVREIDPVFSLGTLERRRRETLRWLAAEGLLDANRSLTLPALPLRIALVTSHGSAAYHDFVSTLEESRYRFRVHVVHAAVQGVRAEREIVSALRMVSRLAVDCVVVVRGGGSRTDLAAFDSRAIAEAIARSPLPVLTGLGHETDEAVADRVAHTALKTPTKVAEHLVREIDRAADTLDRMGVALSAGARDRLRDGRETLERAERGIRSALARLRRAHDRIGDLARVFRLLVGQRLDRARGRVAEIGTRLSQTAPRLPLRSEERRRFLGRRLALEARRLVAGAEERLTARQRLCRQLAPDRTLARGFSITRTEAGRVVRDPALVAPGQRLVTETAGGPIRSRVEES